MENMRPVKVDQNACRGVPLGVAVATDMVAGVDHGDVEPGIGQRTADDRP